MSFVLSLQKVVQSGCQDSFILIGLFEFARGIQNLCVFVLKFVDSIFMTGSETKAMYGLFWGPWLFSQALIEKRNVRSYLVRKL